MKLTAADREWSRLVKDREAWTCQRCGARHMVGSKGLNAHHVFTRSRKLTRHLVQNGVCVCVGCHSWIHRNPYDAEAWLRKVVPDFDELRRLSHRLIKRESVA